MRENKIVEVHREGGSKLINLCSSCGVNLVRRAFPLFTTQRRHKGNSDRGSAEKGRKDRGGGEGGEKNVKKGEKNHLIMYIYLILIQSVV